ncbi:MAG: tyrosine-type recombinase/integrase [Sumerlaeia bacterium]
MPRPNTSKRWTLVLKEPKFNLYKSKKREHLWQVRLGSYAKYRRRQFDADTLENAKAEALKIAGLPDPEEEELGPSVVDAANETFDRSRRGEKATKDWLSAWERFLDWLGEKHPSATQWQDLSRSIIREYADLHKDKAPNTQRLYLQPIIQTSSYMAAEYGLPDIATNLGISSKTVNPPASVYLTDVADFLDWLADHRGWLEAGPALQGLAGLQLQEALRLTWDKVDLERGLIEVSGKTKNEYRNRVIPVCSRLLDALHRARALQLERKRRTKVQNVKDTVVVGKLGGPYTEYTGYSSQVRSAIREFNPDLDWSPKDLRNALPTFASQKGIRNDVWEQYVGHAPQSVTARHYVCRLTTATKGERQDLDEKMAVLRERVVSPIEAALQAHEAAKESD